MEMGETEREGRSAAGKGRTGLWGRGSLAPGWREKEKNFDEGGGSAPVWPL
jgi:hypothetical protein